MKKIVMTLILFLIVEDVNHFPKNGIKPFVKWVNVEQFILALNKIFTKINTNQYLL